MHVAPASQTFTFLFLGIICLFFDFFAINIRLTTFSCQQINQIAIISLNMENATKHESAQKRKLPVYPH